MQSHPDITYRIARSSTEERIARAFAAAARQPRRANEHECPLERVWHAVAGWRRRPGMAAVTPRTAGTAR